MSLFERGEFRTFTFCQNVLLDVRDPMEGEQVNRIAMRYDGEGPQSGTRTAVSWGGVGNLGRGQVR